MEFFIEQVQQGKHSLIEADAGEGKGSHSLQELLGQDSKIAEFLGNWIVNGIPPIRSDPRSGTACTSQENSIWALQGGGGDTVWQLSAGRGSAANCWKCKEPHLRHRRSLGTGDAQWSFVAAPI